MQLNAGTRERLLKAYAELIPENPYRVQQIRVDHDVPLPILVEAVERVFAVTLVVLTDPRRTVSTADTAHGVEGLVGTDVGHAGRIP